MVVKLVNPVSDHAIHVDIGNKKIFQEYNAETYASINVCDDEHVDVMRDMLVREGYEELDGCDMDDCDYDLDDNWVDQDY